MDSDEDSHPYILLISNRGTSVMNCSSVYFQTLNSTTYILQTPKVSTTTIKHDSPRAPIDKQEEREHILHVTVFCLAHTFSYS